MTRTTFRIRWMGALSALLSVATAPAATIDFEGSTLGDDLAAINAAVAALGVDFDVASPPPAIIVDPDDPGGKSLRVATLPAGADVLVNFDQSYDFVRVRFPNEPGQSNAVVSIVAYDHTGTALGIQGSGGILDSAQGNEPATLFVHAQGIRAVQLELNGNPIIVDDIEFEQLCGDGIVDPVEECDDGGLVPGDGCDEACRIEIAGWEGTSGALPDQACPPWTLTDSATPEDPQLAMDLLTLGTSADAEIMSYGLTAPTVFTPPVLVVEARMRHVSGSSSTADRATSAVVFTMAGGDKKGALYIGDGEIFLLASENARGPSATVATSDALHTYRMIVDTTSGVIEVEYDGASVLAGATYVDPVNTSERISFGQTTLLANGVAEWEYVRHNAAICVPATTTSTSSSTSTTASSSTTTSTSSSTATTLATSTTTIQVTTTSVTTTIPAPAARLLPGKKLLVKRKKSGVQRLQLLVRDAAVTAALPCEVDGELIVRALGAGSPLARFQLDASFWKPINAKKPERGCKYRKGPVVATVQVKTGKSLKVIANGPDLGVPLGTDARPVRVEVRHGDERHCVEFGGSGPFKPDKKLLSKKADAAATCPEP